MTIKKTQENTPNTAKKALKHALFTPRSYVEYWMNSRNHTARGVGGDATAFDTLCLDYEEERIKFFVKTGQKVQKHPVASLAQAFAEYINHKIKEELKTALDTYKCNSENLSPLKAWLKAVTGQCLETDLAVIAHWCWMVKRKAYNLDVVHQIMPVIFGKQGGGKTKAIDALIKPIEKYRLTIGMNNLSDERTYEGLANNFVVVFDELQGVARLDMDTLKKQITTVQNSYRRLHTHLMITAPMRASFIGASNKPVSHSFNDNTGMRRFWELKAIDRLDWITINGTDYAELWSGIDENAPNGYLTGDILDNVLESQQKTLVNKEHVEEFVADNLLTPVANGDTKSIASAKLFQEYILWAGRNGITKKLDSQWLTKKLSLQLPMFEERDANGVLKKFFKINASSPIDVTLTVVGGTK